MSFVRFLSDVDKYIHTLSPSPVSTTNRSNICMCMCTLEITLLFLLSDTMEVISRIGRAVAPSPFPSTQKSIEKKSPSKKHAAQCGGCSENNQWPSELIENAPCHFTESDLIMARSTQRISTFRTRRKSTWFRVIDKYVCSDSPGPLDFSSEDPVQRCCD